MYRLMIVEDEVKIRRGLTDYLPWREMGFEVVCEAENGREALDMLPTCPVDVILCDIKMPVMDGVTLASHLYRDKQPVKVVFLSGFTDYEYMRQAIRYGVRDYVQKPSSYPDIAEVFGRIRQELDTERALEDSETDAPEGSGKYDRVIQDIKAYVREHYAAITLRDLEQIVHFSSYYICKLFQQQTGTKFSDYVLSVRMEKAAELLRDYKYKTYEIGGMVGYVNARSFAKAFARTYGMTPAEYRRGPR